MRRVRAVLAFAVLLVACDAADAAPPVIRIAWTAVPASLSPVLFKETDLLRHLGQSYSVEHVHFALPADAVRALAAGEIDLASLSPASFAVAVRNAGLDDLRVVADGYQDGVARHYSNEFLVRDDGPVRAVEDLAGKLLAVDVASDDGAVAARAMLRRHGLAERDYHLAAVPMPSMGALLERGKVDLAALGLPFSAALKAEGDARALFTQRAVMGESEAMMVVARAPFLAANRAALDDFFEDYLRALGWLLDPPHRAEAAIVVATFTRARDPALTDYLFTADDYFRDPGARPNLVALQKNMDMLHATGFIDRDFDVRHYCDTSFIDEAARRLRENQ